MIKKRPKQALIHAEDSHQLDGRTRQAKRIQSIKTGLIEHPQATAKAILIEIIAKNSAIEHEVFTQALNSGLLNDKGRLNPLIQKDMLKFQAAAKSALQQLLILGGHNNTGQKAGLNSGGYESALSGIFDDSEN
jgi:hypothetical protein